MKRAFLLSCLAVAAWPSAAVAAPPALRLAETPRHHALSVRVDGRGVIACAGRARCTPETERRFELDAEVGDAAPTLEAVELAGGESVVKVRSGTAERHFLLVLGASSRSGPAAPQLLLSSWVGRPRGEPGRSRMGVVAHERTPEGDRLVAGSRDDRLAVCGHPTVVGRHALDPATFAWLPVGSQSLEEADRRSAQPLTPTLSAAGLAPVGPRLFRVHAASTGRSDAAGGGAAPADALTDGATDTSWSADTPGGGGGEFVVLAAPGPVALNGVELILPGPTADAEPPHALFLVTRRHTYRVRLDDAATRLPGGRLTVSFPSDDETDCLAVVLGDEPAAAPGVRRGLAEVRPATALDAVGPDAATLAAALDGDDARASLAEVALTLGGSDAALALDATFDRLSAAGQLRALALSDALACDTVSEFLLARIAVDLDGRRPPRPDALDSSQVAARTRERLRTCQKGGDASLARAIVESSGAIRAVAARELSAVAPADAVTPLVTALGQANDDDRRSLRAALATAARSRRARSAIEGLLVPAAFSALPPVTRVDVLRCVTDLLPELADGPVALASTAAADTSFRTRYLLLAPAAALARAGDAAALSLLKDSLEHGESPHLRAQAARLATGVRALEPTLTSALTDAHPRVREATLVGLSEAHDGAASAQAVALLRDDPWTFVRGAAARALGAAPAAVESDAALVDALDDASPLVRRAALAALGRRKSPPTVEIVRARAGDARENTDVRVAAIDALGELCDVQATELLVKLALRAGAPQLGYDEPLGLASLRALTLIGAADLAERLAPLTSDKRVPRSIQELARGAASATPRCR